MAKSVEEALNGFLLNEGKQIEIEDFFCRMNTTLTSDPIFSDGALAFPLDGTFLNTEGNNFPSESNPLEMPFYIADSQKERAQL